jgi:nucleoside-diphosphate kinase
MAERTFSILKPDATERNLTGAVNAVIEKAGLRIVGQRRIRMSREQAEQFYGVHRERPFFGELVEFMTSGPVVVQVLEGENAVARYREVMGATNPAQADEGTIRKLFARSVGENTVHGSDSAENAQMEIAQFFTTIRSPADELGQRRRVELVLRREHPGGQGLLLVARFDRNPRLRQHRTLVHRFRDEVHGAARLRVARLQRARCVWRPGCWGNRLGWMFSIRPAQAFTRKGVSTRM